MKKATGAVVAAVALALPAATATATTTKTISADPDGGLTFSKSKLRVKHGIVKITMDNPQSSGLPHGVAIRGHGLDKDGEIVDPGDTSTVRARLKKGKTYTFYCPYDGHAAAGMKGKVVVK